MRKETATKLFVVIALLVIAIVGVFLWRDFNRDLFTWDYAIIDDTRWRTTMNDGGSNTNVYYQINLAERQVRKCEDKYSGPLHSYEYRGQVIYQKEFDERTAEKLQLLLEKLWQKGDTTEGTYDYYAIEKSDEGERSIHNSSDISQLKVYTDKFDKLSN